MRYSVTNMKNKIDYDSLAFRAFREILESNIPILEYRPTNQHTGNFVLVFEDEVTEQQKKKAKKIFNKYIPSRWEK